jgi:hypothetical protein
MPYSGIEVWYKFIHVLVELTAFILGSKNKPKKAEYTYVNIYQITPRHIPKDNTL